MFGRKKIPEPVCVGATYSPESLPLGKTTSFGKKKKPEVMSLQEEERKQKEVIEGSPYLNALTRHMDVYQELAHNTAQWRFISVILIALLALSVCGNVYLSSSVKVQPYIVQVDEHGYAIPIKMADVSGINERVIAAQIGQFITNSRIRVKDVQAQIIFAKNAYKSLASGSAAFNILNSEYAKNPPTNSKTPVKIDIRAIIPLTPETYQAEWSESTTNDQGTTLEKSYQGIFEIAVSPPKDMANLVNNPLGIYVTDYHIQEKIK